MRQFGVASTKTSLGDLSPSRSLRSPTAVLPAPPMFRTGNLTQVLQQAGVAPVSRIQRARGLLHLWFRQESAVLAVLNTVLSLFLFVLALTMTYAGMRIAQALGLVVTLNEAANAISPYAGVALLSFGALRLLQTLLTRDGAVSRFLGFAEAALLLTGGVWAEAVAWYTGSIPDILKPQLALAGGAVTANIIFFSTVVVPFFKPAIAAGLGGLLTAKQLKTTAVSGSARSSWYVALIGLLASACTLVIGMDAGRRHLIGTSDPHSLTMQAKADLWAKDFSPPFAAGTWCRVSDTFGPRINPFWGMMVATPPASKAGAAPAPASDSDGAAPVTGEPAKPEKHLYVGPRIVDHAGVDLAVRAGTPVHAMADGRVVYAGFDEGFGNAVALAMKDTTVLNGHMEMLNVQPGQTVRKGALIGWVGSTGHSTGPHLHVQVCPQGQAHKGSFRCGVPANPYEVWATLSAIARLACTRGPVGS